MNLLSQAWIVLLTLGVGTAAVLGQAQTMNGTDMGSGKHQAQLPTPVRTRPLKISFEDKAAERTPETLAALPHTSVKVYQRSCQSQSNLLRRSFDRFVDQAGCAR